MTPVLPYAGNPSSIACLSNAEGEKRLHELLAGSAAARAFNDEMLGHLAAIIDASPFLADCLRKELEWFVSAQETGFEKTFEALLAETVELGKRAGSEAELMTDMRIARRRAALLIGVADLSAIWRNMDVTRALSRFAAACLNAAFDFLLLDQHRRGKLNLTTPETPQIDSGLVVLGMGKFGAQELNYSSDIDIIAFYEERPGLTLLTDDPVTLLNRMMRQLIRIMQERTGDGYVFRTDLRLRPDPSSTPLVIPLEAALNYYEGQGQNWERAAMIKARPVAGDTKAGEQFLKELTPFIWRKYLDYAAIQDVHSIKRQIHAHKGHGEIKVPGHNVKLGRGGIREIEFFAQTQQLIAGGRNPQLRVRGTIGALDVLASNNWIKQSTADELGEAYWFLRNLEHRLQMVDDAQTHVLPESADGMAIIAAMFGEADVRKFSKRIERVFQLVESHYASLFEEAPELSSGSGNLVFTGGEDDPETVETLKRLGFRQPSEVIKVVKHWHVAKMPALQTSAAREMLTELVPGLLEALARSTDPDTTLFTFDRFISGLPAGIQFFSILKSNPALNTLLVDILVAAPALADQISRKPNVFDGMLDGGFDEDIPSVAAFASALEANLQRVGAYEAKLDATRRFCKEMQFLTACRFFSHTFDWRETGLALSNLAEAIVAVMLDVVEAEFESAHGRVPGAKTAILAMGRLGSRELTIGSDLDLIFLYDFDENVAQSDGEKPLDPTVYFMRLIKRFITAVTSPTAEGVLYELDFRLRPSGNAGPLATQIDGFLKYQREEAWVWEAQALTRARPVAGDKDLQDRLHTEIPAILAGKTSRQDLRSEIFDMRMRIEKEKGAGKVWDMKTAAGGLLDMEFIAQWLVLARSGAVAAANSTSGILKTLGREHLQPVQVETLLHAFDVFASILHLQRICLGSDGFDEPLPKGLEARLCVVMDMPDISYCEATIRELKREVRAIFNQILGPGNAGSQPNDDGNHKRRDS